MVPLLRALWHLVEVVHTIVDNRIRIALADLPSGMSDELKAECTHTNPMYKKARAMGFKYTKEPVSISTWVEHKGVLSMPRGCTGSVREVFTKYGLGEPDWHDERVDGLNHLDGTSAEHNVQLWDHQEDVIETALQVENCIIRAPTGSGKTTAAIALAVRTGLPTLIIVWSSNLFDQWVSRLQTELGLEQHQIGQIRGAKRTYAPITMAMQQTLYSNPKLVKEISHKFGCVMCDEVQRFAAKTFMKAVDVFPARYRIGWSADERRKDKKEFLIYDVFGRVAADIKQDVLIEKKLVHDVEVWVTPTNFTAQWYVDQLAAGEKTPDFGLLLDSMAQDQERTALAMNLATCEIAFGNQVLMLSHRREHVSTLARAHMSRGMNCGVMVGGVDNAAELKDAVKQMRARKLSVSAGTYQAIGQALDLPTVSRGVACTPIASNKQFFGQVRGRLCRTAPGKKDAVLHYLWDKNVFGIEPLINLKRWNKRVLVQDGNKLVEVKEFIARWKNR